jgi:hypothetical protein
MAQVEHLLAVEERVFPEARAKPHWVHASLALDIVHEKLKLVIDLVSIGVLGLSPSVILRFPGVEMRGEVIPTVQVTVTDSL